MFRKIKINQSFHLNHEGNKYNPSIVIDTNKFDFTLVHKFKIEYSIYIDKEEYVKKSYEVNLNELYR